MNFGKVAMFIVERAFDLAELILAISEKKKQKLPPPSSLSLKDLVEMKRADNETVRRSQAPTVVIPPPSERERQRR